MPLHPQAKKFLEDLAAAGAPAWDQMTPDDARNIFASLTDLFGVPEAIAGVEDRQVGDVRIRVYAPDTPTPLPIVVYFHGGGWLLGDLDTHDCLCRHLANRSACVVVAVGYRRAPECKYPGALNDCMAVVRHIAENAEEYQADAGRIAVAGDSAGGNLAAAAALRARDEGGPKIALQLLIYPITDNNFGTASYKDFAEGYGLTRDGMQYFWKQYLADERDAASPYASPLRAESLQGLPPAHIITAEYDVLRDEGQAYARRLAEAGVPTTTRHYEDMIHGFVHFSGVLDTGGQAVDDAATVIRRALGR